jgi:signal transduction histidine kinase
MARYLIILLILFSLVSYAQNQLLPRTSVKTLQSVRAKVDYLNVVAEALYLREPDSARKIAENALLLSEKYNYPLGKGRSFLNMGHIYWSQSYYPISLFYLNEALAFLPANKPLELADCYRALGRTYADLKNYKLALNSLNKAEVYAGTGLGARADIYSERAYVFCALKAYRQAIAAATYSLKLNKSLGFKRNVAVLYGRLGAIYTSKKDYTIALHYDDTAYIMSITTANRRLRAKTLAEYASINSALNKYDKAIDYAHRAIALSDSIGFVDARMLAYQSLENTFESKNNFKQALAYQKKYAATQDSLVIAGKLKSAQLIKSYFAFNSRMNRIALMEIKDRDNKAKINSQKELIAFLFITLFVLIVILVGTYYLYIQKKELNNKLKDQHKALFDQKHLIEVQTVNLQMVNELKDKLLAVIGHDLRTPVANLSNIIEMFETGDLSASEVRNMMKNMNPIVKGAELTLSNLLEWAGNQIKGRQTHSTNVDIFLLGVEIEQTFKHALVQKNIEFINNAYPGQSVLADENHLKVILRNLVSNAVKFTNNNGTITLTTIAESKGLTISVSDNGKGMTLDEINKLFYVHTHFTSSGTMGEKGTGIGLLLCKELVELNGGKLRVESVIGEGSAFYFNLPLVKAYA